MATASATATQAPRRRRLRRLERSALSGVLVREVEEAARAGGMSTRRTGTSIAVMRLDHATNGGPPTGERRPANLEDVFVLLTGEEVA